MVKKEKRQKNSSRNDLLTFGVAVVISLGGILFTFIRIKTNNKPPDSKPSNSSKGDCSFADSRLEIDDNKDSDCALQDLSLPKISSSTFVGECSSSGRYGGLRNGFLLPEYDEPVKECNSVVPTEDISIRSNVEYTCVGYNEYDGEIRNLRTKVEILEERERNLEIQLLEYYGIEEQETTVKELQHQLNLNNMEMKLYSLQIDSLQSNNRMLEAQVADYAKVVAELESANAKIKVLRRKLRDQAELNIAQISNLQERVMKLQEQEKMGVESEMDLDVLTQTRKEFEEEIEGLKKSNYALEMEKSELAQKLECAQMLATSAFNNEEVQELHKESWTLRHENEDIKKELEQLKADRCTDIEELVYLRWINACLRYELRNYNPTPGEAMARDLSSTLSPMSENRAKQLILEYANKEGFGDKVVNIPDFDSVSSHSYLTDSGEPDDSSVDNLSANNSKQKLFSKLKRLLIGKDSRYRDIQASPSRTEGTVSMDDIASISYKSEFTDVGADMETNRTISSGSSRLSLDLPRSFSRGQKKNTGESSNCSERTSVDNSLNILRTIDSIREDVNDTSTEPGQDTQNEAKIKLAKYAEALKKSRSSFRQRSTSLDLF